MQGDAFVKLVEIMARLRQNCPWDRQQTHQSLRRYILEEAYEVVEAIDELARSESLSHAPCGKSDEPEAIQRISAERASELKEELGDLLLQVVFQSEIGKERGEFSIDDVITTISEKLIRRHPHIFSDVEVNSPDEVTQNWEQIKKREKLGRSHLDGLPKQLPALLKAYRIQSKASNVGAEMSEAEGVFDRLGNELRDLEEAYHSEDRARCSKAFGRILFSLVSLGRSMRLSLEDSLRERISEFDEAFRLLEKRLEAQGKGLSEASRADVDEIWR